MSSLPPDCIVTALDVINRAKTQSGFLKEGEASALDKLSIYLRNLADPTGLDSFADDIDVSEETRKMIDSLRSEYARNPQEARRGNVMGDTTGDWKALRAKALKKALRAAFFSAKLAGALGGATTAKTNTELEEQMDLVEDWEKFDVFKVDHLTKHTPLATVGLILFQSFGLMEKLSLNEDKLQCFLQDVESAYRDNPYHNNIHAADVTQSLACILGRDTDFRSKATDLELLSMLIGAIVHDVGHPGTNNEYLVNSADPLAITYNDQAVNENMHISTAFHLMNKPKNAFMDHLPAEDYKFVRRSVIAIVLATDMAGHKTLINTFRSNCGVFGADFDKWEGEARTNAMQFVVHVADLANPAKPARFSGEWSWRVMQEFFRQGDIEREMQLPQNPMRDRETVCTAASQGAFFTFVVKPTYEVLGGLCPESSKVGLRFLLQNIEEWKKVEAMGDPRATIGRVYA